MMFPACWRLFVSSMSSREGDGSAEGWVWIHTMKELLNLTASLKISRACMTDASTDPIKIVFFSITIPLKFKNRQMKMLLL